MRNENVIGITGRRHLSPEHIITLTAEMRAFYKDGTARYGAESITVLSSLAEGADKLLAIWDGLEQVALDGAGTWETVKLARRNGKPIWRIDAYPDIG